MLRRFRRHNVSAAGFLLFLAGLAAAQNAPFPKYRVINAHPPEKYIAALNAAADQGYRLILDSRFAILRLDATPPDTYRYLVADENMPLSSFLNSLNQQGALGYGWLKDTEFLEKEPHPRNFEYTSPKGFMPKTQDAALESIFEQGYAQIGSFESQPVFLREIGVHKPIGPRQPPVITIETTDRDKLLKIILDAAARGYRYHSTELLQSGAQVALEDCSLDCGGPFEYRSFDVRTAEQLERDLNTFGQEGFRVVAHSLDGPPRLMELPAHHTQHYLYRAAETKDAASAEDFANAGDREGFVPIGFTAYVGLHVRVFLILEKLVP